MNELAFSVPVHRYESTDNWRAVDEYFASTLLQNDGALIAVRDVGVATTMPNAQVSVNQGAFLKLLVHVSGARRACRDVVAGVEVQRQLSG